ncbi:MAG TPA: hypothetical protein VL171_01125 [Verrucomicrobiae bacterium]|nr:hypothetical protein [Verrucomicrobiae bacterium]
MRLENANARRQARVETTTERGQHIRPASDCKTELGHCAKCAVKVTAKNFGAASHGKFLLVWCDRCQAENQQSQLELAAVHNG